MGKYLLEHTQPRVFRIGGLVLLPGVNEVDSEAWLKAKKHPFIESAFDDGDLRWVPGRGPDDVKAKQPVEAYPLKGMPVKTAIAVVKKTPSIAVLEGWKKVETKKEILSAISAQIEEIGKVEEDEDEKKELSKIKQQGGG